MNEAFFLSEQAVILPRNIANKNNATYNTSGGNNTLDKIFPYIHVCSMQIKVSSKLTFSDFNHF